MPPSLRITQSPPFSPDSFHSALSSQSDLDNPPTNHDDDIEHLTQHFWQELELSQSSSELASMRCFIIVSDVILLSKLLAIACVSFS